MYTKILTGSISLIYCSKRVLIFSFSELSAKFSSPFVIILRSLSLVECKILTVKALFGGVAQLVRARDS